MLEHGGNLTWAAKRYGIALADWLDLSTGINPQGYPVPQMPPEIWQRLPSDDDGLTEAACRYYGCQSALPVAGSQAALQVLPTLRAPCRVAMLEPMYQEHAHAWRNAGHQVQTFANFAGLQAAQADVVLLCNPNNPTAQSFAAQDLLELHASLAQRGGWLIIDEAFMDATPQHSIAAHAHLPGLLVLRSLGKFFGLAGARVGFLLAESTILQTVREKLGPWTLTGASRLIAKQALEDTAWQQATRLRLQADSARLAALLRHNVLAPQAGTTLFQYVPTEHAQAIHHALAKQGVWVRFFTNIPALRFGLPGENGWGKLEQALQNRPR